MVPLGIIPFTPSVGVTEKATPLQVVKDIVLIVLPGSIYTVSEKVCPTQDPDARLTR